MPKHRKDESSDSDDGPVDRNPAPSKKSKSSSSSSATKNDSGDPTWTLEKMRKVTVREFKGKVMVDIREYYLDSSGDEKPGKKGISLSLTQFNKLAELLPEIQEEVKKH